MILVIQKGPSPSVEFQTLRAKAKTSHKYPYLLSQKEWAKK